MPTRSSANLPHDDMSIGDVAKLSGVRASALRFYESEKLIRPARRLNGRRRYDRAVLDRLRIIGLAQQVGFTLAEIRVLLRGIDADRLSASWKKLARTKLEQLERDAQRLRAMKRMLKTALECGCADPVVCARVAR